MASVIIPAHNEAGSIGRLLHALLDRADMDEFEVIVVCNGCHDDTADIARRWAPAVQVLDLERPSKHWALVAGDQIATTFPRLYVDADVVLDTADARALVSALREPGVLAAAPERDLVIDRSSFVVRSYYRVWSRLPVVRTGLFGRGVIGLSAAGHARVADRPEVLGDDLYVHTRFAPTERRIVASAHSQVRGPLTTADLVRRRTRAAQGNIQLDSMGQGAASTSSTVRDLPALVRTEPRLLPHLPAFLAITLIGRVNHRRRQRAGSDGMWLRDESSRS